MKNFFSCILFTVFCLQSYGQNIYTINNTVFEPLSYEEMTAPFRMAAAIQGQAMDQFNSYWNSFVQEYNAKNYETAKMYIDRMIALNYKFNNNLYPSADLYNYREKCNDNIKFAATSKEMYEFINDLKKKINNGQYTEANIVLDKMESLNKENDNSIIDPNYFSDTKNYISFKQSINTIVDINDKCLYKNGSSAQTSKNIAYQTVAANKKCRLKKIATSTKQTEFVFEYTNTSEGESAWCNINALTYIIDKRTNTKYTMLYAEGIPLSPGKHEFKNIGDKITFKLVFPAVPTTTYYLDLIEEEDSSWKFFNIKIR